MPPNKKKLMVRIEFSAPLVADGPKGAWTFLYFPASASERLGARARVSVAGTLNGFPIRTSAHPSGTGTHVITVNKAMQKGAGAAPGDTVRVSLAIDDAPREARVPDDLARAVRASAKARALFADLTPRAREEWVEWLEEAKKPDTRARRIARCVGRLEAGIRRVYQ